VWTIARAGEKKIFEKSFLSSMEPLHRKRKIRQNASLQSESRSKVKETGEKFLDLTAKEITRERKATEQQSGYVRKMFIARARPHGR